MQACFWMIRWCVISCEVNSDLIDGEDKDQATSLQFLDVMNRGSLTLPRLPTVHFIHTGEVLYKKTHVRCAHDTSSLKRSVFFNSQIAGLEAACKTQANMLLKSSVLCVSGKERSVECMRRQEKLTS